MIAMLRFAALALATLFAVAAAVAFDWLLLRVAFHLMKPAAGRSTVPRTPLVSGRAPLARSFSVRS